MANSSLQVTNLSLGAKRSALNFMVFLIIVVGITIFILKQGDAAPEEIEKLQESRVYMLIEPK